MAVPQKVKQTSFDPTILLLGLYLPRELKTDVYTKSYIQMFIETLFIIAKKGFPGGTVVGNPPANAGDTGSSPGPGRSHMPRGN